jgi:heme A synthase
MKAFSKPTWWAPFWLFCVAFVVAAGIAFYTYSMNLLVLNFLEAMALAVVFLGFTYYFRVRPSSKMNRAMWNRWCGGSRGYECQQTYQLFVSDVR